MSPTLGPKLSLMGSLGSGRRRTRRACVEECNRFPSSVCPKCSRAVRFVYEVPLEVAIDRQLDCNTDERACRQCLGLTYRVQQMGKCATLRLLEPVAYNALRDEFAGLITAGGFLPSDAPPPDVVNQGRRAVQSWFQHRDAQLARFSRLADQLNNVPQEHVWRLRLGCPIETRAPRRYRRAKA